VGTAQDLAYLASAVWHDLLMHAPDGVRWVMGVSSGLSDGLQCDRYVEVFFDIGDSGQLTNPGWRPLTLAEVTDLCGTQGH
jgi:hypothetical protein